jgi:hypothetical protein
MPLSETQRFILVFLLGIASLLAVSLLWARPWTLFALLLVIALLMLVLEWHGRALFFYALVALWGAAAEVLSVQFGAWRYTQTSALGIPYWLPLVWGNAGLFIHSLGKFLQRTASARPLKRKE